MFRRITYYQSVMCHQLQMKGAVVVGVTVVMLVLSCQSCLGIQCLGGWVSNNTSIVNPSCQTTSRVADISNSQSCVRQLQIDDMLPNCNATRSCMEINVKLLAGSFNNTDDTVWSILGCYQPELLITICPSGSQQSTTPSSSSQVPTTTTESAYLSSTVSMTDTDVETTTYQSGSETSPQTETTNDPASTADGAINLTSSVILSTSSSPTTTISLTSTSAFSNSGATGSVRTTDESNIGLTSDAADNSSAAVNENTGQVSMTSTLQYTTTTQGAEVKNLDSCLTGIITFSGNCRQSSHLFQLEGDDGLYDGMAEVVGCCDDENVCVSSSVNVEKDAVSCQYGEDSQTVTTYCDSCWTFLVAEPERNSIWYGCLADIPLDMTSFADVTTCTDLYKDGICADAKGQPDTCLRCCEYSTCNGNIDSKYSILQPDVRSQSTQSESNVNSFSVVIMTLLMQL